MYIYMYIYIYLYTCIYNILQISICFKKSPNKKQRRQRHARQASKEIIEGIRRKRSSSKLGMKRKKSQKLGDQKGQGNR